MTKQNMEKQTDSTLKDCEKYELAITNFVLGEKMNIPEAELFNHLAKCKSCQGDFRNWRVTHAMMCAKEYDSRPEIKEKNEAFIKNLVYGEPAKAGKPVSSQSLPGNRIPINAKWEIKSAAERIYLCLKENGKTPIPVLRKKTELFDFPFYEALGALADQGRAILHKDKTTYSAEAR